MNLELYLHGLTLQGYLTRFYWKALNGKPMIIHVMERALKSTKLDKVVLGVILKKQLISYLNMIMKLL